MTTSHTRRVSLALAVVLSIITSMLAVLTPAQASQDGQDHKITICHASNSHDNPYQQNKIDDSSITFAPTDNRYLGGHGDSAHQGPVWYPGIPDHSWGDIIPPFTYTEGTTIYSFPGYNWVDNPAGQAIYNNECEGLTEIPVPAEPTVTEPTCDADGALNIPTQEHVTYTQDPPGTGPGLYEVTATADPGFKFADGTTTMTWYDIRVEAKLTGEACLTTSTVAEPTFTNPTCTTDGSVNAPSTDAYAFTITGTVAAGQKVTATATAKAGYTLTGQTSWEHTFTTPTGCTPPPPAAVTAAPVNFVNPTCDAPNAGVQFSNTAQYTYAVTSGTVAPGQAVTVTATATAGNTLTGQTTWSTTFAAVPTNCTIVGGVEESTDETVVESVEDEATDEVVVAGVEELASTGGNLGPAGLGLLFVLAGAAFVGARRFAQR